VVAKDWDAARALLADQPSHCTWAAARKYASRCLTHPVPAAQPGAVVDLLAVELVARKTRQAVEVAVEPA
jgi:hypothetical protein